MSTHSWKKRCDRCGKNKITDGRKNICDDCLYEIKHGKSRKEKKLCEVKEWCDIKECNGFLPCRFKKRKEILSNLPPDIQSALFGVIK